MRNLTMNLKKNCAVIKLFIIPAFMLLLWMTWEMPYVLDTVPEPGVMFGLSDSLEVRTAAVTASTSRDLLIFSYMQSGSSVTGGLLRDSPRTFYMYEPLIPLAPYNYFTDRLYCEMGESSCSSTHADVRIKQAIMTLVNLYSCNMRAVRTAVIDKIVEENKSGKPWEEFGKCLNGTRSHDTQSQIHNETRIICFEKLETACKDASIRVAKVLRLGFETIELLLKTIPNLTVLFLTRDPRAIINSRIKTWWFPVSADKPKSVEDNVLSLCLKMENDIRSFNVVKSKYSSRVRYSTLQMFTSSTTALRGLFEFINKTVTTEDEHNIDNYVQKNSRKNITEKWRTELGSKYRMHVEKICAHVMDSMMLYEEAKNPSNNIKHRKKLYANSMDPGETERMRMLSQSFAASRTFQWLSDVIESRTAAVTASKNRDLLIFSYMRSGSSVTGELLRDSPGTFYMFEPLLPLAPYHYFTDKFYCEMRNRNCSSTYAEVRIKQAIMTLVNLYSCNMRVIHTSVIDKIVEENKSGKPWEEFGKCLNGTRSRDTHRHIHNVTKVHCFEKLETACKNANIRVAKVLRLGFETTELLLKTIPNLTVLFLTRDPRAIINSRIKTRWFPVSADKPKSVEDNVLSLCLKMENDIRSFNVAKSKYPSRITFSTLQMFTSNTTALRGLFEFINKTVTTEDEHNIDNYVRKNSRKNITEKWRTELGF